MSFPDIYTRCIQGDGTVNMARLKRLAVEMQDAYELSQSAKCILDSGLRDIINRVNTRDHSTGMLRDGGWASRRASQAIQEASNIEERGFIEEQKIAQLTHQPINQ